MGLFDGKRGLIFGVANDRSIAWAIAKQIMDEGVPYGVSLEGLRSFFERFGVKDVHVQVNEERSWIRFEKK